jgi:hypothetical protein
MTAIEQPNTTCNGSLGQIGQDQPGVQAITTSIVYLLRATKIARLRRAKESEMDVTEIAAAPGLCHGRHSASTIRETPMLSVDRAVGVAAFQGKAARQVHTVLSDGRAAPRQILVLHRSNYNNSSSNILMPSFSSVTLDGSAQLLICDVHLASSAR